MTTAIDSDSVPAVPAPSSSTTATLAVTMDTQGRVRTSREQRRRILAEFARSGLSAAQFARRTGLKYSTLAGWLQRRRIKPPRPVQPLRLLEAVLAPPAPASSAAPILHLPGGARLEMAGADQAPIIAALLRALEHPTPAAAC
jgi:transposase-like protein